MATNPEVDAWFDDYEHPVKDAMLLVRVIVLDDDRMTETIKWKSPTFMCEGNMASFNRGPVTCESDVSHRCLDTR